MKQLLIFLIFFSSIGSLSAQNDFLVTQYLHNRYAINPAFAGSREGVSLFGSYRQQWQGITGSPSSQLFTAHSPLRNAQMAVGLSAYNQKFMVAGNSGFSLTYAYRMPASNNTWLSFALSPGVSFRSSDWSGISTIEPGDLAFSNNERVVAPMLAFGAAWYGNRFFAGFSIPSFFYNDVFQGVDTKFSLGDATYCFTGGYLFPLGSNWDIQPSFFMRYNQALKDITDVNTTLIYDNRFMLGLSYRTTKEAAITASFQVDQRLRVAYSYDYSLGKIGTYNKGSHEISIQYDFVHRSGSVNPKFF